MASGASTRGGERNVQDWINLICGVLLFLSPWALGFSGDLTAARTAWVGGVVFFIVALGAMVQFAEWEEWIELVVGVLVIIAPWVLGFAAVHAALWSCVVLGVIVVLSSISELWAVHHPAISAR
jgi:uncharacterized membrane protein HdeD (DUF308 family)